MEEDFIYESNLHTAEAFGIIEQARLHKYKITLLFICTDDLSLLNKRVELRHKLGLRYVSPQVIAERHSSAIQLLPHYLNHFDEVSFYDGSPDFPDPMAFLGNLRESGWELVDHVKNYPRCSGK